MTKLEEVKLGDVCDLIAGFAFKSKDFGDYPDKVIKITNIEPPFVNMTDLSGVDLSKYNKQKLEKFMAKKDDYVLAMTGATIGKLGRICEGKAYINQRVLMFKPTQTDKKFLYYVLADYNFTQYVLNHIDSESAQANISATTIGKYALSLPPLEIQKKIAGVLGALDDKIELNNKINNNLEQQAQALFKSWFVDFEPFGGTMPEDWQIKTLKEVVNFSQGVQVPVQKQITELIDGYEQFIRIVDLTQNNSDIRFIENVDKGKVTYDDIFMIRYGTPGILGRNYKGIIANNLFKIEPINNIISKNYIYNFLNSDFIQNYIKQNAVSSTMPAINFSTLYGQELIIPDAKTLTDYTKIDESMRKQMLQIKFENERLTQLRDVLLPKLMSGEIDVSNVDISALTSTDKLSFTED